MQSRVAAMVTAGALAVPWGNAVAAAATAPANTSVKPIKKVTVRKFTGPEIQADRWGTVQVVVTMRKTTIKRGKKKRVTRRYTNLGGSYTYHTDRSLFIMQQSLPILRQEFLQAQSANVQIVSGATYTSQAFTQSLQAALLRAQRS